MSESYVMSKFRLVQAYLRLWWAMLQSKVYWLLHDEDKLTRYMRRYPLAQCWFSQKKCDEINAEFDEPIFPSRKILPDGRTVYCTTARRPTPEEFEKYDDWVYLGHFYWADQPGGPKPKGEQL